MLRYATAPFERDYEIVGPVTLSLQLSASAGARQLVPGQPDELKFSLTPIANSFARGHRLELKIASRPELLATECGEGFDMFCWDPIPYRSRNVIRPGGESPSWLEISIRTP